MNVTETKVGGSVILAPIGRIEIANADQFKEIVLAAVAAVAPARGTVVLDLSRIEYISSAGLRAMMIGSKTGKGQGVVVTVAAMQPVVEEIFTISRFNLVFPCFDTVRAAIEKTAPAALAAYDAA